MNTFTKFNARYVNPSTLRILYVLLALLAMALASGAPDAYGGGGG